MAKVAAIIVSLLMLAAWGYFAWQEYDRNPLGVYERDDATGVQRTLPGFIKYLSIPGEVYPNTPSADSSTPAKTRATLRSALVSVVAFAFAILYMAFSGGGAIFSIQFVVFVSLFTAILHALVAAVLLCILAWNSASLTMNDYRIDAYAIGIYALVTGVAAFVAMRNADGMLRGRSAQTVAVMKALLVLFLVGIPLAPIEFIRGFEVSGYSANYPLAGLCLLALLFIGITRENFRYD